MKTKAQKTRTTIIGGVNHLRDGQDCKHGLNSWKTKGMDVLTVDQIFSIAAVKACTRKYILMKRTCSRVLNLSRFIWIRCSLHLPIRKLLRSQPNDTISGALEREANLFRLQSEGEVNKLI